MGGVGREKGLDVSLDNGAIQAKGRRDTHQEYECGPAGTPPSGEWLHPGGERERFPVDTLHFHTLVEPEIGHSDTKPGDETCGSGEVGKPGKDDTGTFADRHVREEGKTRADANSDVGQPGARCATKYFRGTARDRKTV